MLGECWNLRLERARRRTPPRRSMFFVVTSGRPLLVVASGDKRVDEKKAAAVIGEEIDRANGERELTLLFRGLGARCRCIRETVVRPRNTEPFPTRSGIEPSQARRG